MYCDNPLPVNLSSPSSALSPVLVPPSQPYIQLESDEPWVEGEEYTVTCVAPDAKPPADITMFKGTPSFKSLTHH